MISLASEFTDAKGRHAKGWLFFDADCHFCTRVARCLAAVLAKRQFGVAPLQDPRVSTMLNLSQPERMREMRVLLADGRHFGGADAVLWLAKIPGFMKLLRVGYRWVAARRHCASAPCEISQHRGC